MSKCIEHDMSRVRRIYVHPLTDFPELPPVTIEALAVPMPYIDDLTAYELVFDKETLKVEDKVETTSGRRVHTVTVTFSLDYVDENVEGVGEYLMTVRNFVFSEPCQLRLVYFNYEQKLIRTTPDGFEFYYSDQDNVLTVTLTFTNAQGLTSLVNV